MAKSEKKKAKPQKGFTNASELFQSISDSSKDASDIAQLLGQTTIVRKLFALRNAKKFSQSDLAKKMSCSQSRVSKLENGTDEELRLGDLAEYADALGLDVFLGLRSKDATLADEVKHHVFCIRELLDRLAQLAEMDEDVAEGVRGFFGEALVNFVRVLQHSAKKLPKRKKAETPSIQLTIEDPHLVEGSENPSNSSKRDQAKKKTPQPS